MSCKEELNRLKQENNELKRDLRDLQDMIERLQRTLQATHSRATGEMSAGNVPQKRYEYILSQADLSRDIASIIGLKLNGGGLWTGFPTLF